MIALVPLVACSPGYRRAEPTPAPPSPSATHLLAEEDALRAMFTYEPTQVRGALDRASVRAGGRFRVTGTSGCASYAASLVVARPGSPPDSRPLEVNARSDGAFTVIGAVPPGTPPQEARVMVSTTCGPPEAAGTLSLPLRVTA